MVNSAHAASRFTSIGWAPTSPTVAAVSCSSAKESAGSLYWLLITNVAPHWAPKSVTNYYFSFSGSPVVQQFSMQILLSGGDSSYSWVLVRALGHNLGIE